MSIENWKPVITGVGYEEIVASWNYQLISEKMVGEYQGDYLYLLRDPRDGQIGFLTMGYGSCSGCDELQACSTQKDVEAFRSSLHSSIIWKEADQFWDYFASVDREGKYYGSSDVAETELWWVTNLMGLDNRPLLSPDTLQMMANPQIDPAILADSFQEDGFEMIPRALREPTISNQILIRLRRVIGIEI